MMSSKMLEATCTARLMLKNSRDIVQEGYIYL